MDGPQQVREVVERWAAAVRAGDLDAVVADHDPDVLMFDVPRSEQVVRGLDAYRATWPGFFDWLASGATFEIETLEVTAGDDVAFAVALLHCGTAAESEADPERRLRLTVGLRRSHGRWLITHEHHSFAVD